MSIIEIIGMKTKSIKKINLNIFLIFRLTLKIDQSKLDPFLYEFNIANHIYNDKNVNII